jgi:uncharacterized membrane protein
MRALIVGICAVLGLAGLAVATDVQYKFGTIAYEYPGAIFTAPQADSSSEIVGYYETSTVYWGYIEDLRQPPEERFQSIQPEGSWASWPSGINAHGVAVGGYCSPPQGCSFPRAQNGFTLDHGVFTNIDYPGAGSTAALGINDSGDVVGGYCSSNICPAADGAQTNNAFLEKNGAFTTIDFPGAIGTQANAINDAGVIVGAYDTQTAGGPNGFLYQGSTFATVDVPGSTFTYPSAINNKGVVAGYYQLRNLSIHGFLRYKDGTFLTVDHPGTPDSSLAGI